MHLGGTIKILLFSLCGDEETNHPKTNAADLFEQEAHGKICCF